jgi:hypothetical protein
LSHPKMHHWTTFLWQSRGSALHFRPGAVAGAKL